jgi:ribosomal protein L17
VEEVVKGTRVAYRSESRTETFTEMQPRQVQETTTQTVAVQVPFQEQVTTYIQKPREVKGVMHRQVAVQVPYTETVTTHVQRAKQVTDIVERTYSVQVPYTETVTVTRKVPRTVTKQVPVCETVWERQSPAPAAAPVVAPSAQK